MELIKDKIYKIYDLGDGGKMLYSAAKYVEFDGHHKFILLNHSNQEFIIHDLHKYMFVTGYFKPKN